MAEERREMTAAEEKAALENSKEWKEKNHITLSILVMMMLLNM